MKTLGSEAQLGDAEEGHLQMLKPVATNKLLLAHEDWHLVAPEERATNTNYVAGLVIDIDNFFESERHGTDFLSIFQREIKGILTTILASERVVVHVSPVHYLGFDEFVVFLWGEHATGLRRKVRQAARAICKKFRSEYHTRVTVGLSGPFPGRHELRNVLERALRARDQKLLFGGNRVYEGATSAEPGDSSYDEVRDCVEMFVRGLWHVEEALLRPYVDQWCAEVVQRVGSVTGVRCAIITLLANLVHRHRVDASLFRNYEDVVNEIGDIHELASAKEIILGVASAVRGERSNAPHDRLLAEAKRVIAKHFGQPITLADVADMLHISQYHLAHIFQKRARTTFKRELTKQRIDEAIRLLSTTHLPVSEIAERVGFTDARYFSELFRRKVGSTPTHYRSRRSETMGKS